MTLMNLRKRWAPSVWRMRKILIDFGEVLKFMPAPSSGQINTALSKGCLSAAVKWFIGKRVLYSSSLWGQHFLNEMLMCSRCMLVIFAHTSIMEIHNCTLCIKVKSLLCCEQHWRSRRGRMFPWCLLKVISSDYYWFLVINFMSCLKSL